MKEILTEKQREELAAAIAYYLRNYIWDDTGKHDAEYFTLKEVIQKLDLPSAMPDDIQKRT